MSVMARIDQSCISSADKANKDGPTTAATAPTLKKTKNKNTSQPHMIHDAPTPNQSKGECVVSSPHGGNRHVASYRYCVTIDNRHGRATEPLM